MKILRICVRDYATYSVTMPLVNSRSFIFPAADLWDYNKQKKSYSISIIVFTSLVTTHHEMRIRYTKMK